MKAAAEEAQDRVLEHALTELLAEHARDDELARAVAAAWERGERGSGLADLGAFEAPPAHRGRRVRWLAAAALIGGLALAWWLARPGAQRGAIVARAATPVQVLGDALASTPRPARVVRAGQAVLTRAGERATLELETGATLALGGDSLLAFGLQPELLRGALRLETGPGERATVALGLADAAAEPDTVLEGMLETPAPGERTLRLAVARGTVRLTDRRHGEPDTLTAGAVRVLRAAVPPPLAADDAAWLARRFEELFTAERKLGLSLGAGEYPPELPRELVELSAFLERNPAGWEAFGERAEAAFRDPARPLPARQALVFLLVLDESPQALALARRLWPLAPESFPADAVVAFAGRGAFELEREGRAMLEPDDAAQPLERLWAAAWLFERGEREAERTLLALTELEPQAGESLQRQMQHLEARWLAAAVLARAGDARGLERLASELPGDVDRALAAGQTMHAALHVLAASFARELAGGAALDARRLSLRWMSYVAENAGRLQTPSEIRAALEGL